MFQLAVRVLIAGLILWGFLALIFWIRKPKKVAKTPCGGQCHTKAPEGVSENKTEEKTDAKTQ
jgi:hypothetical protein